MTPAEPTRQCRSHQPWFMPDGLEKGKARATSSRFFQDMVNPGHEVAVIVGHRVLQGNRFLGKSWSRAPQGRVRRINSNNTGQEEDQRGY